MSESMQTKKGRVRPPRVHITYDVEIGGAEQKKEIPFVVGVVADLAGKQKAPPKKLKDRSFVEIDRENFNDVLGKIKPRLAYKVDNTLQGDGSELSVELEFKNMGDFEPDKVARQVDPLRDLLDIRNKLKDLEGRTEGNDRLAEQLDEILSNADVREKLKSTLNVGAEAQAAPSEGEAEAPATESAAEGSEETPTEGEASAEGGS